MPPPSLPRADYPAAARRHMLDAEMLGSAGRRVNAGQLHGFAAECAIKAVAVWRGFPVDDQGAPKRLRKHIDALAGPATYLLLESFLDGRVATRYLAAVPGIGGFADWSTDHRYWADSDVPSGERWREAASQALRMLDEALLDGAP